MPCIVAICCCLYIATLMIWFFRTHWDDIGGPSLVAWLNRDPRGGANREGWFPNWMQLSLYPDFIIGGAENPYIKRRYIWPRMQLLWQLLIAAGALYFHSGWWLLALLSPYLHVIIRSDDDRALHTHPSWNFSIILLGGYVEVVPDYAAIMPGEIITPDSPMLYLRRNPGNVVFRRAKSPHRLVIEPGAEPAVTIFIFGPKLQTWGFLCPQGLRHWLEFTGGENDPGHIGRGCD
jgi:hypothetical protein